MPYKRSYRKRRFKKSRRGLPWYSRKYSASQLASKAWSMAKYLKSLINTERNYIDTNVNSNPSTTGALTHLTALDQGVNVGTRVGNSVKVISFFAQGTGTINASATNTIIRVIYFIYNDNTTPLFSDILDADNVNANRNIEKTDKVRVLHDRKYLLNSTGKTQFALKVFSKLQNHIKFTSTLGSNYEKGSIWMYIVSSEATNTPGVALNHRVKFIDN